MLQIERDDKIAFRRIYTSSWVEMADRPLVVKLEEFYEEDRSKFRELEILLDGLNVYPNSDVSQALFRELEILLDELNGDSNSDVNHTFEAVSNVEKALSDESLVHIRAKVDESPAIFEAELIELVQNTLEKFAVKNSVDNLMRETLSLSNEEVGRLMFSIAKNWSKANLETFPLILDFRAHFYTDPAPACRKLRILITERRKPAELRICNRNLEGEPDGAKEISLYRL